MEKRRILYIDLLKFIAILFVTWGHTMGQFGTQTEVSAALTSWRFTIDMPLFAILSGLFFKVPETEGLWPMLWKKMHGLLVPNVVWCFVFYVLMHGVSMTVQFLLGKQDLYQGNLLGDWWHAMWFDGWWFLRALLFVYVYAICSVWIVRKLGMKQRLMLIAGLGSSTLLYVCSLLGVIPNHHPVLIGAIYLYPFVWAGVAIKSLDGYIARSLLLVFVTSLILWTIGLHYWNNSYTFYGMNTSIYATEGSITGVDVFWVTLFRFVVGIAASLTVTILIRWLAGNVKHGDNKILDYLVDIGKYTLFIYIAPSFFFHAVKQRVIFENEIGSFVFCTLLSIILVVGFYWCAKILDRWKWSRRLLLGIWK